MEKKNRNKDFVYLGIVLTLFIFYMGVVMASDWTQYGGSLKAYTRGQIASNTYGGMNLTNGVLINNMSQGYDPELQGLGSSIQGYQRGTYELLVRQLVPNESANYLILPNENFLQVYDKNLILIDEIQTGRPVGQIATTDFENDGTFNDIVGIYRANDTIFSFKSASFDSGHNLNFNFQTNFTANLLNSTTSGIRCVQTSYNECYFVISVNETTNYVNTFYLLNESGIITSFGLPNTTRFIIEPPMRQDVNNNLVEDYLVRTSQDVFLFDSLGTLLFNYSTTTQNISDAKLFHPDSSPNWKILIGEGVNSTFFIYSYNPTGTLAWTSQPTDSFPASSRANYGKIAITNDYDNDGFPDIFVAIFRSNAVATSNLVVLKGTNGATLKNDQFIENKDVSTSVQSLNIARLGASPTNSSVKDTFIISHANQIVFYSPEISNSFVSSFGLGGNTFNDVYLSCIPADLTFDGYLEVICTGQDRSLLLGRTEVWGTNLTNQLPQINSVAFDPSTTIQTGQTLNILISASDFENDQIFYSRRCFASDNFSADTTSSTLSCSYATAGVYNLTARVRDVYHTNYDQFSQIITVTDTGSVCNNNDICEADLGETTSSCPSDCPSQVEGSISGAGGLAIPAQLVDPDDTNEGFLPEIYFGLTLFFSYVLAPALLILAVFFLAFIIVAIFGGIKALAKKATG